MQELFDCPDVLDRVCSFLDFESRNHLLLVSTRLEAQVSANRWADVQFVTRSGDEEAAVAARLGRFLAWLAGKRLASLTISSAVWMEMELSALSTTLACVAGLTTATMEKLQVGACSCGQWLRSCDSWCWWGGIDPVWAATAW